jgi:hypothetical protein
VYGKTEDHLDERARSLKKNQRATPDFAASAKK